MHTTKSIPLGKIPSCFEQCDFTEDETVSIMSSLVQLWRFNDHPYDMTCEYINTELDLEDTMAGMLIVYSIDALMEVAAQIRALALSGKFRRYSVFLYTIIVELDND